MKIKIKSNIKQVVYSISANQNKNLKKYAISANENKNHIKNQIKSQASRIFHIR